MTFLLRLEWKQNCHFGDSERRTVEQAPVTNLLRPTTAECFDAFNAVPNAKLTFLWHNGKSALPVSKAKPLCAIAASLKPDDRFDFDYVGGERADDASVWRFEVAGLRKWQEDTGIRGLNALAFSWPIVAVQEAPDAFAKLFFYAAEKLKAIHGQVGYAVNLSPAASHENEATEYWIAQQMPGLDVGSPILQHPTFNRGVARPLRER